MNDLRESESEIPARFKARLFGDFDLRCAETANVTPPGRKARAILAYLLLSGPEPVARERLSGLLWGERGEDQARASLRQALYELRPLAGGTSPLLSVDRGHVRLKAEWIDTDLTELRSLKSGDDAAAVASLLGERPADLLSDLNDIDASFDDWLAGERVRRGEERHQLAVAIAHRALLAHKPEPAYRVASCLLAVEPFDEEAVRLAMEASCRLSGHDSVRRIFTRYSEALLHELDTKPPPEMLALLGRLLAAPRTSEPFMLIDAASHGLALSAEASTANDLKGPLPSAVISPAKSAARFGRLHRSRTLLIVIVAAVIVASVTLLWLSHARGDGQHVIMVEPFTAANGDAPALALGEGFASDLSRLIVGNGDQLNVIDRGDFLSAGKPTDYLVVGDARSSGDQLHVGVRLLDHQTGSILWSRSFTRAANEVDGMRDQIASHIADVSVCALGGNSPSLATLGIETMRLYLQACDDKHGDWNNSVKLLAQIVQYHPEFAHAWAMLAAATAASAGDLQDDAAAAPQYRLAENYARRALRLNPREGEAYAALAFARPAIKDWPRCYDLLMKGYLVDPNNDVINTSLAYYLMRVGRRKEGMVFAQRSVELAPFYSDAVAVLLNYQAYGNQIEQTPALLDHAARRWPDDPAIADTAFHIAGRVGDAAAAVLMLNDPKNPSPLAQDRKAVWKAFLEARLNQDPATSAAAIQALRVDVSTANTDGLLSDAADFAVLGQKGFALMALDRIGRQQAQTDMLFYNYMAPLRSDPHFMTIAARQGLVRVWQQTRHWPDFCSDPSLSYNCRIIAAKIET